MTTTMLGDGESDLSLKYDPLCIYLMLSPIDLNEAYIQHAQAQVLNDLQHMCLSRSEHKDMLGGPSLAVPETSILVHDAVRQLTVRATKAF